MLWYFATVFLGLWVVDDSLGQFAASHRIVMALHTFVWMYFYNLLPTICRTAAAPGKDLRATLGPVAGPHILGRRPGGAPGDAPGR